MAPTASSFLQRVTKVARLPRGTAAAPLASTAPQRQAVLQRVTKCRACPSSTASSSPPKSHQVPHLPRETAAASTASMAALQRVTKWSKVTRVPRKTAAASTTSTVSSSPAESRESPSSAPATRVTKPRRQRRQAALQRATKWHASATQSSRGVSGVQSGPVSTERHQVQRLLRRAAAAHQVASAKWIETS